MKNELQITIAIIFCLESFSCRQKDTKQTVSYLYSLQETGQTLSYENEKHPFRYRVSTVLPFTDKAGHKYMSFQETDQNTIHFYELYTGHHFKTLEIEREGPNGLAHLSGYYIKDFDEIYLTNAMLPFIARADTSGQIYQKIGFEKTDEGEMLVQTFTSTTHLFYKPLVMINDTFYIVQETSKYGKEPDKWPVACYIDTTHKSVKSLPLCFPPLWKLEEIYSIMGSMTGFSRCFDGVRFVYSFNFEESITVASIDHKDVQKIPAKSKYLKKINPKEKRPDDRLLGIKRLCEAPFYGNLIHDPYRNVYYRVAYIETEMEDEEVGTYIDIWTSGRKRFSIIILDNDFNIIGETLFPDYKYCCTAMFVEKEGLYIRTNHLKSPDFVEDKLMFNCLELVKNEK